MRFVSFLSACGAAALAVIVFAILFLGLDRAVDVLRVRP